jgi:diadenosine tetraphosphatase ApaH/serine/threonine PP2A family protein phosphatase
VKYLVLSDIHANLEALDAALAAAGAYDRVLVLGDLVGYGADPNAVIERVRALPVAAMIRGNHDKVAAGLESTDGFNYVAREAITWTTSALTPEHHGWLAALPCGPVAVDDSIEICHGTPFDEDMYVFDHIDALRALRSAERPVCLYGHTHVPAAFRFSPGSAPGVTPARQGALDLVGPSGEPSFVLELEAESQYLVNCGAIGQPRDGNPDAAFGIVDADAKRLTIMRVAYDIRTAQEKIVQAGLPEVLAKRLALGR